MASRIDSDLLVELTWETLLGLDKEPREIRDLCKRRQASQFVVFTDSFGQRAAGLVSRHQPDDRPGYALAGILAGRANGKPMLFLHSAQDQADHAIVIGIRDGRPELDRLLPIETACHEAALFLDSIDGHDVLHGNLDLPGVSGNVMALPSSAMMGESERRAYRTHPVTQGMTIKLGKNGQRVLAGGTAAAGMAFAAWVLWPEPPPPVVPTIAVVDPLIAHTDTLRKTLAHELDAPSLDRARHIESILQNLPVVTGHWRITRLTCEADRCTAHWSRVPGGTFESLLMARPNALVNEANLDEASEAFELDTIDPTETGLKLAKRDVFYRQASSRAQTLRDHDLIVKFESPAPLLPLPPALSGREGLPAMPEKGQWQIAGHLAFLDSVGGLLARTGNMSLTSVTIETDTDQPRFNAEGDFYVE